MTDSDNLNTHFELTETIMNIRQDCRSSVVEEIKRESKNVYRSIAAIYANEELSECAFCVIDGIDAINGDSYVELNELASKYVYLHALKAAGDNGFTDSWIIFKNKELTDPPTLKLINVINKLNNGINK